MYCCCLKACMENGIMVIKAYAYYCLQTYSFCASQLQRFSSYCFRGCTLMRLVVTEVGKQGQPTPFTLCQAKVGVIHP